MICTLAKEIQLAAIHFLYGDAPFGTLGNNRCGGTAGVALHHQKLIGLTAASKGFQHSITARYYPIIIHIYAIRISAFCHFYAPFGKYTYIPYKYSIR